MPEVREEPKSASITRFPWPSRNRAAAPDAAPDPEPRDAPGVVPEVRDWPQPHLSADEAGGAAASAGETPSKRPIFGSIEDIITKAQSVRLGSKATSADPAPAANGAAKVDHSSVATLAAAAPTVAGAKPHESWQAGAANGSAAAAMSRVGKLSSIRKAMRSTRKRP